MTSDRSGRNVLIGQHMLLQDLPPECRKHSGQPYIPTRPGRVRSSAAAPLPNQRRRRSRISGFVMPPSLPNRFEP